MVREKMRRISKQQKVILVELLKMNLQLQKDLKHKFSNDHYAVNNGKQSRILWMKRKKSARKTKQNRYYYE